MCWVRLYHTPSSRPLYIIEINKICIRLALMLYVGEGSASAYGRHSISCNAMVNMMHEVKTQHA